MFAELPFLSSLVLSMFAPNLFQEFCFQMLMQTSVFILESPIFKDGTLFKVYINILIYKRYIKMYSCLPFVNDGFIVKGNSLEMLHCSVKVLISSFLWRKHELVISESSITYKVLYSIYLSVLSFLSLLKLWNFSTQHGALMGLKKKKWRHPLSKGKPLTSCHFKQLHQVCVLFSFVLQCSMNMLLQLYWRTI